MDPLELLFSQSPEAGQSAGFQVRLSMVMVKNQFGLWKLISSGLRQL